MNINKNSSICKIWSIAITVMFSSFLVSSMTSITTGSFGESFVSVSDSVGCFSGT